MTEYRPGDAVKVARRYRWSRNVQWIPDVVKRVTAASVITEEHGAFRLKSGHSGVLERRESGTDYSFDLAPTDHPYVVAEEGRRLAAARSLMRDRVARGQAVAEWVSKGTQETLVALVDVLWLAQSKHGESA